MSPLTRQRMLVEQKALVVERDQAVLEASCRRLVSRIKREVTGPVALVTMFVAGLAFGALRRGEAEGQEGQEGQGGRLMRAALAGLSTTRLLQIARSVDALIRG